MTGKDHLITGTAVLSSCMAYAGIRISRMTAAGNALTAEYVWYPTGVRSDGLFLVCLYSIALIAMFWLGILLPDCDSRGSIIGKVFYLPVKHRTWTHTLWVVFLLMFAGSKLIWLKPLAFGYFLHLLADSVSSAGICWFYPIDRYITYPNGAFVAKGHKLKFYHTGSVSETVVVVIICVICLLFDFYFGFYQHGYHLWFSNLLLKI